jgi:hypothetical protein
VSKAGRTHTYPFCPFCELPVSLAELGELGLGTLLGGLAIGCAATCAYVAATVHATIIAHASSRYIVSDQILVINFRELVFATKFIDVKTMFVV